MSNNDDFWEEAKKQFDDIELPPEFQGPFNVPVNTTPPEVTGDLSTLTNPNIENPFLAAMFEIAGLKLFDTKGNTKVPLTLSYSTLPELRSAGLSITTGMEPKEVDLVTIKNKDIIRELIKYLNNYLEVAE